MNTIPVFRGMQNASSASIEVISGAHYFFQVVYYYAFGSSGDASDALYVNVTTPADDGMFNSIF